MTNNYIQCFSWNPFRKNYLFFDTDDYHADQIFIRHGVPVKFGREMKKDDNPYRIIFCSIGKKYEDEFYKCMDELGKKMLITGHTDYYENADEVYRTIFGK